MSKKIKLIDLANIIVNEEEIPNKIKTCGRIYEYHKNSKNYYNVDNYEEALFENDFLMIANEEVEIIEEEPEIDIQGIEELEVVDECEKNPKDGNPFGQIIYRVKEPRLVGLTVNQIIKAIKQLDNQINNK